MGAGKTTVARSRARRGGCRPVAADQLVAEREHAAVADLFARKGEPYFRAAERSVLVDQIGVRHAVVATGGGTFVDPQNPAPLTRGGTSIWLDVPLPQLIQRVPADGRRPLAAD